MHESDAPLPLTSIATAAATMPKTPSHADLSVPAPESKNAFGSVGLRPRPVAAPYRRDMEKGTVTALNNDCGPWPQVRTCGKPHRVAHPHLAAPIDDRIDDDAVLAQRTAPDPAGIVAPREYPAIERAAEEHSKAADHDEDQYLKTKVGVSERRQSRGKRSHAEE